jgi:glycosyltransferase involved in cell wall biosynthesis
MLRALRQQGARLRVLCFMQGEYWESAVRKLGIPVICVGHASRLGRIRDIVRELRRNRPDILQSAHFYTNGYAQVAARLLGIQEIGAIRCDVVSELSSDHRWLRRLSLSTLRAVAANSRAAIRSAEQFGFSRGRLRFLPNVVDTTHFRPAARHGSGCVRVLGAGRLTQQKRFDRFLRVLARVRKNVGQDVTACIAGAGPLQSSLEKMAAELGMPGEEMQFAGAIEDMAPFYREFDVFLLTSVYEGTPNVVLEAMASGLPVIATRVGDVPELISDGVTGYLVEVDDENLMAERLETLVCHPELRERMGQAAREYVSASHSVHKLPEYLQSLYSGILLHESAPLAHC